MEQLGQGWNVPVRKITGKWKWEAMIIAGRLVPEITRDNNNGRWIKGNIMPYGPCGHLLNDIGKKGQSRLPFTVVTSHPLPKRPVVAIGALSEYAMDSGRIWYTLEISEYYEKGDPALEEYGTFDELAQKIADKDPETIAGLGDRKARVKEDLRKIFGSGNSFPERMIDLFGASAYDRLRHNPWQMIHMVPYFTMKQADQAAEYFGIPLTDENRFREHFRQRINLLFDDRKDTYMSDSDFYGLYLMDFAQEMGKDEFLAKTMHCEEPLVFKTDLGIHPAQFYYDEMASVALIKRAGRIRIPNTDEISRAEDAAREAIGFTLTEEQDHGFRNAFHTPVHFVTGGPGTGKTTLLSAILKKLEFLTHRDLADPSSPVMLVAPTGKAAYRMWEQTGMPARTIHSAFQVIPDYGCVDIESAAESLSHVQYLIIDESSMLDTHLFGETARIIAAMDHIPFMLLVGDIDQLAPVGHGQVFKDLLEYAESVCPECVTRLTVLKRQEKGSSIPQFASFITKGTFPGPDWFKDRTDVVFVDVDARSLQGVLEKAVLAPRKGNLSSVQLMTPFRNGDTGDTVPALNNLAQPYYNPEPAGRSVTVNNPDRTFQLGSRVINKKNRTETIINGSIGTVTDMDTSSKDLFEWSVTVKFDSGDEAVYMYGDLKELDLAYAITVHASQGSEYEDVVLCVARNSMNAEFLNRNLLYTAVTRAVKRLVLLGSPAAFAAAAATPAPVRKTALSEWLKDR